jgi:hypothetical protein
VRYATRIPISRVRCVTRYRDAVGFADSNTNERSEHREHPRERRAQRGRLLDQRPIVRAAPADPGSIWRNWAAGPA